MDRIFSIKYVLALHKICEEIDPVNVIKHHINPDRPQIVVAFVVDQKGVLVTHCVWPGNQTDAISLEPVDTCLSDKFGLEAP